MLRWNERRLVSDIKLLFRSLLYDRRSVEMVVLALIFATDKQKEEEENGEKEERTEAESECNKYNATSRRCSVTTKI